MQLLQEGMFGLREWEDEGFLLQIQEAEDHNYDPAPVRRTRQTPARVWPFPCLHFHLTSLCQTSVIDAMKLVMVQCEIAQYKGTTDDIVHDAAGVTANSA